VWMGPHFKPNFIQMNLHYYFGQNLNSVKNLLLGFLKFYLFPNILVAS
jgi:hypothetical protein